MRTLAYLISIAGQFGMLWYGFTLYRKQPSRYLPLALLNLFFMGFDSMAIFSGRFIGAGDTLRAINAPRFWTHALFTPTLIIFGYGVMRRCGIAWAQKRGTHIFVCVIAVLLIALGSWTDIVNLDLKLTLDGETVRYKNAHPSGPPIPVILVNVFLIAFGFRVGRKTLRWGMFICAVIMFMLAPLSPKIPALGNLAELFIAASFILGELAAQEWEKR